MVVVINVIYIAHFHAEVATQSAPHKNKAGNTQKQSTSASHIVTIMHK